jgi:hypothetical protein
MGLSRINFGLRKQGLAEYKLPLTHRISEGSLHVQYSDSQKSRGRQRIGGAHETAFDLGRSPELPADILDETEPSEGSNRRGADSDIAGCESLSEMKSPCIE